MKRLLIIPSIDIKYGKTVRIVQGIPELNTPNYGNDPLEMAMIWRTENAKILHVVDFDAVHQAENRNFEIIGEMCQSVVIPIEYGGGIHSLETAEILFDLGVYRLVVGSLFFDDKKEFLKILDKFGPSRISAAIDVRENEVLVHSRHDRSGKLPLKIASEMKEMGVERFIVTDIARNGMLGLANIELSRTIALETGIKVTHSGGITTYEDLLLLQAEVESGVDAAIIGRALYENRFSCQKLWRQAEQGLFN